MEDIMTGFRLYEFEFDMDVHRSLMTDIDKNHSSPERSSFSFN